MLKGAPVLDISLSKVGSGDVSGACVQRTANARKGAMHIINGASSFPLTVSRVYIFSVLLVIRVIMVTTCSPWLTVILSVN